MDNIAVKKSMSADEIIMAWNGIKKGKPGIRIREAATFLQLSEAQLLSTLVGDVAIRLKPDWSNILKRLPELGYVMSLTRNDACILEHKGAFEKINVFESKDHHMATVIGPIETRVFLKNWHAAFAVKQKKRERLLTSLQIFDRAGEAITKIYLQKQSDFDAYEHLVADFTSENQSRDQEVTAYPEKKYNLNVDTPAFLQDWSALKDTHDFFPLLRNYNLQRHHAMQLAEGNFSYPFKVSRIQEMLERCAQQKLPIMIFAGNRGNLQIHQDKVKNIRLLERGHTGKEQWLNVLDPKFNMHLRLDLITSVWMVKKPTSDGLVTSVECYDDEKNLVVQFFGLRKPGQPELKDWRKLVDSFIQMKN